MQNKQKQNQTPRWLALVAVAAVVALSVAWLAPERVEPLRIANLDTTAGEWEQVPTHETPSTAELLGLSSPDEEQDR